MAFVHLVAALRTALHAAATHHCVTMLAEMADVVTIAAITRLAEFAKNVKPGVLLILLTIIASGLVARIAPQSVFAVLFHALAARRSL